MKNLVLAAIILGTATFGFCGTGHAQELSAEKIQSSVETQDLSHWTQFRDGFLENVLGVHRNDDRRDYRDHGRHYGDGHRRHHAPPPPPRHGGHHPGPHHHRR